MFTTDPLLDRNNKTSANGNFYTNKKWIFAGQKNKITIHRGHLSHLHGWTTPMTLTWNWPQETVWLLDKV